MASDRFQPENLLCAYCSEPTTFVEHSRDVYHGRDFGPIYRCIPCGAHVGCHPGTHKPLGRVANAELRKAKQEAHAAFDPLWRTRRMSRREAYRWLAKQLGIAPINCHIGAFDLAQCQRVVEVSTALASQRRRTARVA